MAHMCTWAIWPVVGLLLIMTTSLLHKMTMLKRPWHDNKMAINVDVRKGRHVVSVVSASTLTKSDVDTQMSQFLASCFLRRHFFYPLSYARFGFLLRKMPELGFFTFLLINAWLILAYSDSIQNYETVTIDGKLSSWISLIFTFYINK